MSIFTKVYTNKEGFPFTFRTDTYSSVFRSNTLAVPSSPAVIIELSSGVTHTELIPDSCSYVIRFLIGEKVSLKIVGLKKGRSKKEIDSVKIEVLFEIYGRPAQIPTS